MIEIHTACKSIKEAEKIAGILLKKKIAACANYFPINSLYLWKGKTVKDKEILLIIKTKDENKNRAIKEIKKCHSYEIPAIIVHESVNANKEYEKWIDDETD